MKAPQNFKLIGATLLLATSLAACDKPGPAETAGKNIDQTMDAAGKKITDTVEKVEIKMGEQSNKAGVAMDDTGITTKIKAAYFAQSDLKTLQISVDTVQGVVTLNGSVNSQANSDMAKAMAGAVEGVSGVINNLVVMPKT